MDREMYIYGTKKKKKCITQLYRQLSLDIKKTSKHENKYHGRSNRIILLEDNG